MTHIESHMEKVLLLFLREAGSRQIIYHVQPIADRVALNLEIISKTYLTNQTSAHGIYD